MCRAPARCTPFLPLMTRAMAMVMVVRSEGLFGRFPCTSPNTFLFRFRSRLFRGGPAGRFAHRAPAQGPQDQAGLNKVVQAPLFQTVLFRGALSQTVRFRPVQKVLRFVQAPSPPSARCPVRCPERPTGAQPPGYLCIIHARGNRVPPAPK